MNTGRGVGASLHGARTGLLKRLIQALVGKAFVVVAASGLIVAQQVSDAATEESSTLAASSNAPFIRPVSAGPSIFESPEHQCQNPETAALGYRSEPTLAVNPTDAKNIIAVWRQDQWEGGTALSDVTAYSTDGGKTWTEVLLQGLTFCTGGAAHGASDPSVSFGPDGTAYFVALQFFQGTDALSVYRSTTKGASWEGPFVGQPPDNFNDKPAIVADPYRSGVVYLVFLKPPLMVARSDDYGATWTLPVAVDVPISTVCCDNPAQLSVLPDGALVAVFNRVSGFGLVDRREVIHAARSDDGGRTWKVVEVAEHLTTLFGHDADTGTDIRLAEFFVEQATAPDGSIYALWSHNDLVPASPGDPSHGAVFLSRSTDGGRTWSSRRTVAAVDAQVLDPAIAVASDGTVGVMWPDLRHDRRVDTDGDGTDDELTMDWWFARSSDGGITWTETHLAGPLDLRHARFMRGRNHLGGENQLWIGDYFGVAARRDGFDTVFIRPMPSRNGITQSDVMYGKVGD